MGIKKLNNSTKLSERRGRRGETKLKWITYQKLSKTQIKRNWNPKTNVNSDSLIH
jgi:hypothetical protein